MKPPGIVIRLRLEAKMLSSFWMTPLLHKCHYSKMQTTQTFCLTQTIKFGPTANWSAPIKQWLLTQRNLDARLAGHRKTHPSPKQNDVQIKWKCQWRKAISLKHRPHQWNIPQAPYQKQMCKRLQHPTWTRTSSSSALMTTVVKCTQSHLTSRLICEDTLARNHLRANGQVVPGDFRALTNFPVTEDRILTTSLMSVRFAISDFHVVTIWINISKFIVKIFQRINSTLTFTCEEVELDVGQSLLAT